VHRRAVHVVLIVVVGAVLLGGGAGIAGADHGEPVEEDEIVQVQTVSNEGTEAGEVTVSYSYHVGEEIAGLDVTLSKAVDPTALEGFEATDEPRTYRWDERTAEPTIEARYPVNRSTPNGLAAVDTGEWTMISSPNERSTSLRFSKPKDTNVSVTRKTTVAGEGFAGETMVYLGPHEHRTADDDTIDIVVSDAAAVGPDERETTLQTIERGLERSTAGLDVGADQQLTLFVIGEPLRAGGLAIGSDFWVHERTLPPDLTLWHEFVHTQQRYDVTASSEWTIEGGADYYASLLALEQGEIQYREFQQRLARGADYDGVTLADPDTWEGTRANYQLGALVLAALDQEIRTASDSSFEDVLRAMNGRDGQVNGQEFEQIVTDVAGTNLSEFVDEYVRSPPPEITVPLPTTYDAGNDDAALDLEATDATVTDGEIAEVAIELTNEGTETSLAPTLAANASGDATASIGNGTRAGDRLVFEHLPPGESVETTVLVESGGANTTLSLAVEDMSGVGDDAEAGVTVVESAGDGQADNSGGTDGEATDDEAGSGASDGSDDAASDDSGPGFGIAVGAVALLGTGLLARRLQPQEN
jgi:PGF-CTERM protein